MSKSKIFVSLLATAAIFFGASSAGAVEFAIVGPTSFTGAVDDEFTINLTMRNASLTQISSIGASIYGYDQSSATPMAPQIAEFVGGEAVPGYLYALCFPASGCFNGLDNLAGGELVQSSIGTNGPRVQIVLSATLTPVSNDGSIDPGLDDVTGTTQFSATFRVKGDGVITIGTGYEGDGIVQPDASVVDAQGATFTVTVPEPAALLAGMTALGSVLAIAGIRRKS